VVEGYPTGDVPGAGLFRDMFSVVDMPARKQIRKMAAIEPLLGSFAWKAVTGWNDPGFERTVCSCFTIEDLLSSNRDRIGLVRTGRCSELIGTDAAIGQIYRRQTIVVLCAQSLFHGQCVQIEDSSI